MTTETLVKDNMGLAYDFTRKRVEQGYDYHQSFSDANLALFKAAETYEEEKSQFSTWYTIVARSVCGNTDAFKLRQMRNSGIEDLQFPVDGLGQEFDPIDPKSLIDDLENQETVQIALNYIKTLDEKRQYIVQSYFGLGDLPPKTFKNIGKDLGISKQRVQEIFAAIMTRLQEFMGE